MKRHTFGSCKDYVIETLFWTIIAFIWYENLFFTNIDGKTIGESNVVLIVIIVLATAVNTLITISWNRTTASAITALLIPYGIYTYITYVDYMPIAYKFIAGVAIGLCVFATIYILSVKLHAKNKRQRALKKTRMAYSTFRFVGAAASISLIICLFCNVYLGGALLSPSEKPATTYGEEYTIASNMDTVLLLQENQWQELSLEERMDVLQIICNIEGNYLGLNHGIHIYASKLDEDVLGYYNDSASSIQISVDLLESGDPYSTLECVCHEMCHAGQARYVEIFEGLDDEAKKSYFLYDASIYAEEFHDYKNASTTDDASDYIEYYGQRCEQTARNYARAAVSEYYKKISEYLEQDGNISTE